jgi:predicted dehydrogenase/nucleoside-diphosphate-sugar epimerase
VAKTAVKTARDARRAIRVAVVGCGAVARRFYLPVLAGHPDARLGALVDPDGARAAALARDYRVELVCSDVSGLSAQRLDAAIVCTPPSTHAEIVTALARAGIHALVEKPMATDLRSGEAMTEAAEHAGIVLSVALFTRLLPSSRLARALLRDGWLGLPQRLDVRYGRTYDWPAVTLGNLSRELSGGGVLLDSGSHLFDQLLYLFGPDVTLRRYRDNSAGGVESDCRIDLEFRVAGKNVEAAIELSRTRELKNTLGITCEKGTIELRLDERQRVSLHPRGLHLHDSLGGVEREFELGLGFKEDPGIPWPEAFRLVVDDFLEAIRERRAPVLTARSALPSLRLIDECYRRAEPLDEPGRVARVTPGSTRRVLITGATGFLGCRAAELLTLRHGWQVRAAVHTPAHARRLARLPVEMVMADLRSAMHARRLVEGCDAVVHCALGTGRDARAVTVEGTRNLAEAALKAKVERFIHLSSIAVYGLAPGAAIEESTPLRPARRDDYAQGKLAAEAVIEAATARGLNSVILRPARIYGPFSDPFVVGPLRDLRRGKLAISRSAAHSPAQMVFVDNVVFAILCSLTVDLGGLAGIAFNVSDQEQPTCEAFYRFFAEAAELPLPVIEADPENSRAERLRRRLESLEQRARAFVRARLKLGPTIYRRPEPAEAPGEIIFPRESLISIEKAERLLGYRSIVSTQDALQQTLDWARYAEILPPAPPRVSPAVRLDAAERAL